MTGCMASKCSSVQTVRLEGLGSLASCILEIVKLQTVSLCLEHNFY